MGDMPTEEERTMRSWTLRVRKVGGGLSITVPTFIVRSRDITAGNDVVVTWNKQEPDVLKVHLR